MPLTRKIEVRCDECFKLVQCFDPDCGCTFMTLHASEGTGGLYNNMETVRKDGWLNIGNQWICKWCVKRKEEKKKAREEFENQKIKCHRCGSPMVLRKNSKTQEEFWGCSNFPKCKGTMEASGIRRGVTNGPLMFGDEGLYPTNPGDWDHQELEFYTDAFARDWGDL